MKRLFLLAGILTSQLSFCGDLDDGIGLESGIHTGNDLQKDMNVKFIIRKSKAAAQNSVDGMVGADGEMGTNVGGVNMIGGKIGGDVIIIQDIKGDVTTIGK